MKGLYYPGYKPDGLFKKQCVRVLRLAMRVANHADLEAWKGRRKGKGVEVEGAIDHGMMRSIYFHDPNGYRLEFTSAEEREDQVFRDEMAMARTQMEKWTAWKASRDQEAAEAN